jgi:hypothetical protein
MKQPCAHSTQTPPHTARSTPSQKKKTPSLPCYAQSNELELHITAQVSVLDAVISNESSGYFSIAFGKLPPG